MPNMVVPNIVKTCEPVLYCAFAMVLDEAEIQAYSVQFQQAVFHSIAWFINNPSCSDERFQLYMVKENFSNACAWSKENYLEPLRDYLKRLIDPNMQVGVLYYGGLCPIDKKQEEECLTKGNFINRQEYLYWLFLQYLTNRLQEIFNYSVTIDLRNIVRTDYIKRMIEQLGFEGKEHVQVVGHEVVIRLLGPDEDRYVKQLFLLQQQIMGKLRAIAVTHQIILSCGDQHDDVTQVVAVNDLTVENMDIDGDQVVAVNDLTVESMDIDGNYTAESFMQLKITFQDSLLADRALMTAIRTVQTMQKKSVSGWPNATQQRTT